MTLLSKKIPQAEHDRLISAKDQEIQTLKDQLAALQAETDEEEEEESSDLEARVAALEEKVNDHESRIAALEGGSSEDEEADQEDDETEAQEGEEAKPNGKKVVSISQLKKENAQLKAKLSTQSSGGKTPVSKGDNEGGEKKLGGIHPPEIQTEVNLNY